jgi:hypothetical protein
MCNLMCGAYVHMHAHTHALCYELYFKWWDNVVGLSGVLVDGLLLVRIVLFLDIYLGSIHIFLIK